MHSFTICESPQEVFLTISLIRDVRWASAKDGLSTGQRYKAAAPKVR